MPSEEEEAAAATTELKRAAAAIAEPKGAAAKSVRSPCMARSATAAARAAGLFVSCRRATTRGSCQAPCSGVPSLAVPRVQLRGCLASSARARDRPCLYLLTDDMFSSITPSYRLTNAGSA
jgi:hypothetical protein